MMSDFVHMGWIRLLHDLRGFLSVGRKGTLGSGWEKQAIVSGLGQRYGLICRGSIYDGKKLFHYGRGRHNCITYGIDLFLGCN